MRGLDSLVPRPLVSFSFFFFFLGGGVRFFLVFIPCRRKDGLFLFFFDEVLEGFGVNSCFFGLVRFSGVYFM